jgi:CRP-like cAMP-binding protein
VSAKAQKRRENRRAKAGEANVHGEINMQADALSSRLDAVAARPVAELLECPPETGSLLNGSAQCIEYQPGDAVFRQGESCKGLYLIVSGTFVRRTDRMDARITLGPARVGDLLELAAALGDGKHTYTLTAQGSGSVLMIPFEALQSAFTAYPPLRMQLLEELAREVSRAYTLCSMTRIAKNRRRNPAAHEN